MKIFKPLSMYIFFNNNKKTYNVNLHFRQLEQLDNFTTFRGLLNKAMAKVFV